MTDQYDLFNPPPPPPDPPAPAAANGSGGRKKRATRWKMHVVDIDDHDIVYWDVLVTDWPPANVRAALNAAGLDAIRPKPTKSDYTGPVFSELDPKSSIEAAHEHHARRETKRTAVLLLLVRNVNQWVHRPDVRKYGGDSGDRRVRELRDQGNWPIDIRQLDDGDAWSYRLNIPDLSASPTLQ